MLVREAYILAGPTASGKSDIASTLAREMGAWILSADSMLVYRGMDIGTAKPSASEREEFHMGGVDVVTPAEDFSSGAWLRAASAWAADVPKDAADALTVAAAYKDTVVPVMASLRKIADELESSVDSSLWPYPTYGDLLFGI